MLYSFVFFLVLFVSVGLLSYRFSKHTAEDYLLASKEVKPWMVGFSIFATENSGFMFVGFVGMAYTIGLSAIWLLVGWFAGELLIWRYMAQKLRAQNDVVNAQTYGSLIAKWTGEEQKYVRYLTAILTIAFLSIYAAAQLSAGSKALNVLMGWDLNFGIILGFFMVVTYCIAGGIRATIWTDAVQAIAMLGSLTLIVAYGFYHLGGVSELFTKLNAIDPELTNLWAGSYRFGLIGFSVGWLFAGLGVIGQPHIMVRWMVLDKPESAKAALAYYAAFFSALAILCIVAAMCARALFPELMNTDPELALPTMSSELMPGILSGLFLAGLFAATMSTADSQVLSSSAALTQDLFPKYKDNTMWVKAGTVFVALLALSLALSADKNVLGMALYGWSAMACSMGPVLFLHTIGKSPSEKHALAIMISGVATAVAWTELGPNDDMFAVLPGVTVALLVYAIPAMFMKRRPTGSETPAEPVHQD